MNNWRVESHIIQQERKNKKAQKNTITSCTLIALYYDNYDIYYDKYWNWDPGLSFYDNQLNVITIDHPDWLYGDPTIDYLNIFDFINCNTTLSLSAVAIFLSLFIRRCTPWFYLFLFLNDFTKDYSYLCRTWNNHVLPVNL